MDHARRQVLLGLVLAACLGANALADTPIVVGDGPSDVADSSTGPFDPVIEEPLRPLFDTSPGSNVTGPSACGSMQFALAPLAILMMQSLCSTQRKRPARLP